MCSELNANHARAKDARSESSSQAKAESESSKQV
jgi:hypothetical protein